MPEMLSLVDLAVAGGNEGKGWVLSSTKGGSSSDSGQSIIHTNVLTTLLGGMLFANSNVVNVPRDALDVPFTDQETLTDTVVYTDPLSDDVRYFLPQYSVGTRRVGSDTHYELSFQRDGDAWTLTVALVGSRPEGVPPDTRMLEHTVRLQLSYSTPVGDGGALPKWRELETTSNQEGCVGKLTVGSLAERDEILYALTTPSMAPRLLVDRSFDVAMLTAGSPQSAAISPTSIDVLLLSPNARWNGSQLTDPSGNSRDGADLPFNGDDGDARGFVILSDSVQLEDGINHRALRTHPKWVEQGTIKGWHPDVPLPDGAMLHADVGFVAGAFGTDGVEFIVFAHRTVNGRRTWGEVLRHHKTYTGELDHVAVSLAQFAGQSVGLELRVDAGPNSGQDWAAWTDVRIVGAPAQTIPLYQKGTRTLKQDNVFPVPFFDRELHRYIFSDLSGADGGIPHLTHRQVTYQGVVHHYYESASSPGTFLFIPDTFKIGRRPQVPHGPAISVAFAATGGDPTKVQARLTYIAYPLVDSDRLDASASILAASSPLHDSSKPIVFECLRPSSAKIRFRMFLPDQSGGFVRSERIDVVAALDREIVDLVDLDLVGFQAIFDALLGLGFTPLFSGEISVNVTDTDALVIPFSARAGDLVGPVIHTEELIEEAGRIRVILRNDCESSVHLPSIKVDVVTTDETRPAVISDVRTGDTPAQLPIDLSAGSTITFIAAVDADLQSRQKKLAYSFEGMKVEPKGDAIWDSILDDSVRPPLDFELKVTLFRDIFDQRPSLRAVVIEFENGPTVDFTSPELGTATPSSSKFVRLPLSLEDVVLHRQLSVAYRYRVSGVGALGGQPPSAWIDGSGPLFPVLTSITS